MCTFSRFDQATQYSACDGRYLRMNTENLAAEALRTSRFLEFSEKLDDTVN